MKQIKKFFLVFILFAIIFVSGCINMEVNQKINSDSSSEIEIIYDLSAIAGMSSQFDSELEQQESMSDLNENLSQACTEFNEKTDWKNAKCITTDDYKIIMSGEISLKDSPDFKITRSIPFITYRYDVKNIYTILSDINVSEDQGQDFSDESLLETKSMSSLFNMEWEYTLEMPGKITNADVGEIKDNKVIIDMFDLAEEDHVYVESQELNLLWNLGVIAIIIGIIAIILILKRRV